jgi:nitrate reductase NapE component
LKEAAMTTPEQKKANLRLALILASVVAVFFVGFIARMVWMG